MFNGYSLGIAGIRAAVLAVIISLLFSENVFGQTGLGIDASTPAAKLDVNGDLALRIGSVACTNGSNNNVSIGGVSFVRVSGPSSAFSITGIAGGVNGKVVILYNSTAVDMTIGNQNASSTTANRIICSDNVDAVVKQKGTAMLIYSSTDSRWILVSVYKT